MLDGSGVIDKGDIVVFDGKDPSYYQVRALVPPL